MRILFLGDVVGRSGRRALFDHLPALRDRLGADFVVVNGENAAGGFGITAALCREFYAAGVDVVTTGNHVFDQRDLIPQIDQDSRLVRPLNMIGGTPGRGLVELQLASGRRVVVLQVLGRLFMGMYDDPFAALDRALRKYPPGAGAAAIVVDVHAEATSEKMAIGHFLDGRVTLVAGTHTHVPTADAQVLPGGTAYITDLGMTGDYDSVIGMAKDVALRRFRSHLPGPRNTPALGEATVCGVLVESDDATGRARSIEPVRVGGRLRPAGVDGR